MVALTQAGSLDFAAATPELARETIREALRAEPSAARRVYAGLAHKVWSMLIERRFDDELRDWHLLLHQVKTSVRKNDEAAAERVTALADLVRESISLAETSPASEMAQRPNARRILEALASADALVPRRILLETLGMRSTNLSNVLTNLIAHDLIERRHKGKEAEFRITRLGRRMLGEATAAIRPTGNEGLASDVGLLAALLKPMTLGPEKVSKLRTPEDAGVWRMSLPNLGLLDHVQSGPMTSSTDHFQLCLTAGQTVSSDGFVFRKKRVRSDTRFVTIP